ncbi:MAG: hypothetical protein JWO94_2433, partial [Verrucomicrobiaceae bacterium]|nr:hypothetical protein [Verrucomicrobiaceae bacterium]
SRSYVFSMLCPSEAESSKRLKKYKRCGLRRYEFGAIMIRSYLVIYWDRKGGERISQASNELPRLSSARRELRERGYRHDYGSASLDEVEEWSRSGYANMPSATIHNMKVVGKSRSPNNESQLSSKGR